MNAIPFDTLKFARALQMRGAFTDEQPSILVDALGEVLSSDLASKGDIRDLSSQLRETEARLETRVRETALRLETGTREAELRLETKIAESKTDTIKWFFGVIGIQTLAIIGSLMAIIKSLPHS